jgi:hypothetical protein
MVDVSKEIQDFDKDPERMEAVVNMGNGFSVKLIKGKDKRQVEKIKLPSKKGPKIVD